MTCIIGLRRKGRVWLAGDGQGFDDWNVRYNLSTPKVFCWNDVLAIGGSGSFRALQIVEQWLHTSDLLCDYRNHDTEEPIRFVIGYVVPAIKSLLEKHNYSEKQNEKSGQDSYFMFGYKGQLFLLQSDYSITPIADSFTAIGIGYMLALGAMDTLVTNKRLSPETILTRALMTTTRFCATVSEPFTIVSV